MSQFDFYTWFQSVGAPAAILVFFCFAIWQVGKYIGRTFLDPKTGYLGRAYDEIKSVLGEHKHFVNSVFEQNLQAGHKLRRIETNQIRMRFAIVQLANMLKQIAKSLDVDIDQIFDELKRELHNSNNLEGRKGPDGD